jgi:hypothetical protein
MANFETEINIDVLDLVYSLPKQKQIKLIKALLSNLDSNELVPLMKEILSNMDNNELNK